MFPKSNRIPHEVFMRVFRTGRRIHNENFLIIALPNSQPLCRFAVQVGVKIDKRATQRNRMKRLVRESIRHLLPSIKSGFDFIIIAQKNFAEKKNQEIEVTLKNLIKKSCDS